MGRKDKVVHTGDAQFPGLGAIMRQIRQSRRITLTKMAELAGYTKNYLSSIENGNGRPSKELLEKYEEVLELERGELTRTLHKTEESTQQQQNLVDEALKHPLREDWGEAPDVHLLYGRKRELEELERWAIDDRCKM